jgi:hypothetical protein
MGKSKIHRQRGASGFIKCGLESWLKLMLPTDDRRVGAVKSPRRWLAIANHVLKSDRYVNDVGGVLGKRSFTPQEGGAATNVIGHVWVVLTSRSMASREREQSAVSACGLASPPQPSACMARLCNLSGLAPISGPDRAEMEVHRLAHLCP